MVDNFAVNRTVGEFFINLIWTKSPVAVLMTDLFNVTMSDSGDDFVQACNLRLMLCSNWFKCHPFVMLFLE